MAATIAFSACLGTVGSAAVTAWAYSGVCRSSTDLDNPTLVLEASEICSFIRGAKHGLADDLLT